MGAYQGRKKKKEGNFTRAIELLEDGLSIRATGRQLRAEGYGADSNALWSARQLADIPERCKCGGKSGHRGWCSVRYASSPKRQAFMKQWHSKAT